ncbi:MAG: tetratricopeptide repeat protein [Verrucomicrobiales bacterium]
MPQSPEEGLKPTATPGYARNFRDLNEKVSRGKSFSGYERNPMFLNLGGKGFAEVAGLLGVDYNDDSRAVAVVDWDRDGDLDMWVTNRTAPRVRLLRNSQPSTNSSISIRLVGNGKTTNRDAIGARLTLSQNSGAKQIRTVRAGEGFLAQSSAWTHFGLGQGTGEFDLTIAWPGGTTETFSGLKAGARYTIPQGDRSPGDPTFASAPSVLKQPDAVDKSAAAGPDLNGFWVANQVPFPELKFTDKEDVEHSTQEFLGKPLLVNFWATWCLPCLAELSDLGRHADDLRAQGVAVLALNVDGLAVSGSTDSQVTPEETLERAGYRLPFGFAQQENLAMIEILIEYLSARRMPLSIPSSFLIDAKGNVAAVYLAAVGWEQLSADLALLNGTPDEQLRRASPRAGKWFVDPRQIDREVYLSDYATLFATNGFPEESTRLYAIAKPEKGDLTPQEFYNQAKAAAQQGLVKEAMELYTEAIRLDPQYGQALTGLGALYLMQKRFDDARPLFEKALSIDPNHATALVNLSMIDQASGDKESALKRLRQVISRNPGYAEAHLNIGSLLASMQQFDEAAEHLAKAAELNPKIAYAHYGLGMVQAQQGKHREAVVSLSNAIALGSRNPRTFVQLGQSQLALGEKSAAAESFRSALKLDPKNVEAQRAMSENGLQSE